MPKHDPARPGGAGHVNLAWLSAKTANKDNGRKVTLARDTDESLWLFAVSCLASIKGPGYSSIFFG
jgi:hypothetical protein